MKAYEQLSTQGKIRRFHCMAHKALARYPVSVTRIQCISVRHNIIFRVLAQDGNYMLRIGFPQRTALMVESEMRWLEAMQGQVNFRHPIPIRTTENQLLTTLKMAGNPYERHIVLTSWLRGSLIAASPTPSKFRLMGQALADLHLFAENFQPEQAFMRFDAYNPNEWGDLRYLQSEHPLINSKQAELFTIALEKALESISYWREKEGLRLIHADVHSKNAVWYRGSLGLIDFDDCRWGHPLQDWGVILHHLSGLANRDALKQAFFEGYQQIRPLHYSESDLRLATIHRLFVGLTFVIHHRPHLAQEVISDAYQWLQNNL